MALGSLSTLVIKYGSCLVKWYEVISGAFEYSYRLTNEVKRGVCLCQRVISTSSFT